MFKITLYNDNEKVIIHEPYVSKTKRKIKSGQVTLGINAIDTFSFSLYPNNQGFNKLHDCRTDIRVFDIKNQKYVFDGRVLQSKKCMTDSGLIYKEITCESLAGYLCDSKQPYIEEKNWSTLGLFTTLINNHNNQIESKKHINLGNTSYLSSEDNIYIGIQRENTWDSIKTKLIDKIGGEVKVYRRSDGNIYIDYVEKFGEYKTTSICLKKNMKSIDNESDPSSFVTRLIPLGAKTKEVITDANGNTSEKESEKRVDITSVNNGLNYIDDIEAKNKYGIIVGYQYWDDVTEPLNLLNKGKKFLSENNKIVQKYMVSALDLSLIGMDANSFDIYNYYDIKNHLLGIDEKLRITKKTIDILNFQNSTFEFGNLSKTLSEIQINSEIDLEDKIKNIEANYVKNKEVNSIILYQIENSSLIKQLPEDILLQVKEDYYTKSQTDKENELLNKKIAAIELDADSIRTEVSEKVGNNEIISLLNIAIRNGLGVIEFLANQFKVSSDHLIIDEYGDIIAENSEFNNAILRGGNLLLKDDGSSDGASIKIETLTHYLAEITLNDDLSNQLIFSNFEGLTYEYIINNFSNFPIELISSENYKIVLNVVEARDGNLAGFWLTDSDGSILGALQAVYEDNSLETDGNYELPADFGNVTYINSLSITQRIKKDNAITRETAYSGYGMQADIISDFNYTTNDVEYVAQKMIEGEFTPEDIIKYDTNKDGIINTVDLSNIQRYVLSNITPTNPGKFIIDTHAIRKNIQFKDGVGNEKLTLGLDGIYIDGKTLDDLYGANNILWQATNVEGGYYMTAEHTAALSEKISDQSHGIILVWWAFNPETRKLVGGPVAQQVIPKYLISDNAMTFHQDMHYANFTYSGTKVVNISNNSIKGNDTNTATGTGGSGIKYSNNRFVLSYVIGF